MRKKMLESLGSIAAGSLGVLGAMALIWYFDLRSMASFLFDQNLVLAGCLTLGLTGRVDNFGPLSTRQRWAAEGVVFALAFAVYLVAYRQIMGMMPWAIDLYVFGGMYLVGSFVSAVASAMFSRKKAAVSATGSE